MHRLDFEIAGATLGARIDKLIIAGWTGRDLAAVEQHIAELAAVGVRRPATVPCFYRLGANLLTQAPAIDVAGCHSSGEVEVVLLSLANGLHVGVGSDHTDRKVEVYGVTVSKQMCPKPVEPRAVGVPRGRAPLGRSGPAVLGHAPGHTRAVSGRPGRRRCSGRTI